MRAESYGGQGSDDGESGDERQGVSDPCSDDEGGRLGKASKGFGQAPLAGRGPSTKVTSRSVNQPPEGLQATFDQILRDMQEGSGGTEGESPERS